MHKHCVEKQQQKESSLKGHTAKVREIPRVRPAGCPARAPRQCPRLTPAAAAAACPARGSPPAASPPSPAPFHQPRGPCVTGKHGERSQLTKRLLLPERAVAPRFRLALGRGRYLSASSGPAWPLPRDVSKSSVLFPLFPN